MPYNRYRTSNNATGTPVSALSAGGTTLILNSGQGAKFPSVFPYLVTIEERDIASPYSVLKREIVKVTNKVGDSLTIVRSAGTCPPSDASNTPGTTAFSFTNPSQTNVTLAITSETIDDIQEEIANKLAIVGGLRNSLSGNRAMVTNSSGNEIALSGSAGQVVGWDGSGNIVATSPSQNIATLSDNGQLTSTHLIGTNNTSINTKRTFSAFIGDILNKVGVSTYSWYQGGQSSTDYTGTAVSVPSGGIATLTISGVQSPTTGNVYIEWSADGSTGWTTIASVLGGFTSTTLGSGGSGAITALVKPGYVRHRITGLNRVSTFGVQIFS